MRRLALLSACALLLAVSACGGSASLEGDVEDAGERPVTTSGGSATTSTLGGAEPQEKRAGSMPACPGFDRSSPATFDAAGGRYAAHIVEFVATDVPMTFDVIQWLVGDDARRAFQEDNPGETEGPPNDYWVRNESDQTRQARVAEDVEIWLVNLDNDPPTGVAVDPATPEELGSYLEERTPTDIFWLTFDAGAVVDICEQYVP